MRLRHLVIERVSLSGKTEARRVRVQVEDQTPIGPWVTTLAARFGYPLTDSFGAPITYRLCSLKEKSVFPTTGRFGELAFRSGDHFVLEAEAALRQTLPLFSKEERAPSVASARFSRRSLLTVGGSLTLMSLLGLGSGMATEGALRQPHALTSKPAPEPAPITLTLQRSLTQQQRPVRTVAWSPDGRLLASGGDDAHVWLSLPDGSMSHMLSLHEPVRALAFSPDGTQVAIGAGRAVSFFDAHTAMPLAEIAGVHTAPITALAWTQTTAPFAISTSEDQQAVVWDGQSYQPHLIFRRHTTAILALATLGDLVATASQGGVIRLWRASSGQEVHGYFSENAPSQQAVAWSSSGLLALGGDDGVIRLWQNGAQCLQQAPTDFGLHCLDIPRHLEVVQPRPMRAIAFSLDGRLLASGGDDRTLVLWSLSTGKPVVTQPLPAAISALAWSAPGQLAVAAGMGVTLWQRASH